MTGEIGLGLQGDKPPPTTRASGGWPRREAWTSSRSSTTSLPSRARPLLELARVTERVRLGPAALNPFTVHPVEIAGQIAALDEPPAGARTSGSCAARGSSGRRRREPAADSAPRGGRGRPSAPRGRRERLRRHALLARARAGAAVRGLPADGAAPDRRVGRTDGRARRRDRGRGQARRQREPGDGGGAAGADRNPTSGSSSAPSRSWTTTDRARARARAEAALYFPVVAGLDPTLDVPPGLVDRVRALVDAGDRRAAGELIPDHLLDSLAFSGTPEDVVRQVEALYAAGAHRVESGRRRASRRRTACGSCASASCPTSADVGAGVESAPVERKGGAMRIRARGALALAVALVLTLGAGGASARVDGGAARPAPSIQLRIGTVLPFTGDLAAYGKNLDQAVRIAVALQNESAKRLKLSGVSVRLVGSEDGQTQVRPASRRRRSSCRSRRRRS